MGTKGAIIASIEKNKHQYHNNIGAMMVVASSSPSPPPPPPPQPPPPNSKGLLTSFGSGWRKKVMFGRVTASTSATEKSRRDYVSVMRPCFELLRIHGLFPYRIVESKKMMNNKRSGGIRTISWSKLGFAYSTLATSVTVGLASLALYQMDVSHRLTYNSVPAYLQVNCYILLGCSIAASSYLYSEKRMKFLSELADMSRLLLLSDADGTSSSSSAGQSQYNSSIIAVKDVLGFVFLLGQTPNVYAEDWSLFNAKSLSLYLTLVVYLMDSLYVDSVLMIEAYFRRINGNLVSLKRRIGSSEPHLLRRIYHEHKNPLIMLEIRSIKRQHNEVSELVQRLNSTFSLQMVATVTLTFAEITFSLYFYILTFNDSATSFELKSQIWYCYFITSVTYYALKMISIVYACEMAKAQATTTGIIVHQLLIDTTDRHLKEELQLFSLQLLHRDNTFQAKGLCLDATLITSIVGGITTYLLILIQFLLSEKGCSSAAAAAAAASAVALTTSKPPTTESTTFTTTTTAMSSASSAISPSTRALL